MRFPTPTVSPQVGQSQQFSAPRTVPMQDATGEQLDQFGSNMVRASEVPAYFQDQQDDARVKEADALTAEAFRKILRGDGGYLHSSGKVALDGRDATVEALRKARSQAEKLLGNESQRILYGTYAQKRLEAAQADIDGHYGRASQAYLDGQIVSRIKVSRLDGVDQFDEPVPQGPDGTKRVAWADVSEGVAVKETNALADLRGVSPEERKLMVLETTTAIHAGRVQKMVAQGRADKAKAYYDGIKPGEVDSETATRISNVLRTASVSDEAGRLSLKIIDDLTIKQASAQHEAKQPKRKVGTGNVLWEDVPEPMRVEGGKPVGEYKVDYSALMTDAREMLTQQFRDGKISREVMDTTWGMLEKEHDVRKLTQSEKINSIRKSYQEWLSANPTSTLAQNPLLFDQVRGYGLLGEANNFADDGRYVNDPMVAAEVQSAGFRARLAREKDLRNVAAEYRGKVNNRTWAQIEALFADAHDSSNLDKDDALSDDEIIRKAAVDGGAIPRGVDSSKWTKEDTDAWEAYQRTASKSFATASRAKNRKLTPDEKLEIVDKINLDKAARSAWGSDRVLPAAASSRFDVNDYLVYKPTGELVYLKASKDEPNRIVVPKDIQEEIIADLLASDSSIAEKAREQGFVSIRYIVDTYMHDYLDRGKEQPVHVRKAIQVDRQKDWTGTGKEPTFGGG